MEIPHSFCWPPLERSKWADMVTYINNVSSKSKRQRAYLFPNLVCTIADIILNAEIPRRPCHQIMIYRISLFLVPDPKRLQFLASLSKYTRGIGQFNCTTNPRFSAAVYQTASALHISLFLDVFKQTHGDDFSGGCMFSFNYE